MTNDDKQALINNTATIETKIIVYREDGSIEQTLTQDNAIKTWDYNDNRYVENEGFIGQFVARTLDGELQNVSDDFNIQNKTIEMQLGIRRKVDGEFKTTYYSYGHFIVSNPEDNEIEDNTSFESMDYTIKFNKRFSSEYTDSTYTTSLDDILSNEAIGKVTLLWLAQYACKQAGVELGTTNFRNYNKEITSNQFEEIDTCRDVMKEIGKLAMSWVRIGVDDKVYLDFSVKSNTNDAYDIITNDNYYKLETQKDVYGKVNKVSLASSVIDGDSESVKDDPSIALIGVKELPIYDSKIAYTQELRQYFVGVGTELFGFTYRPLKVETTGHPWISNSDYVIIKDMENNAISTYPFNINIKYSGHIRTTFESPSMNDNEVTENYKGSGNTETYSKYSKVVLDRELQEFRVEIGKTSGLTSRISTLETNYNGITGRVTSIETLVGNEEDASGLVGEVATVKKTAEAAMTDSQVTLKIQEALSDGSFETETGYTFDKDGLNISKSGAETSTKINENGMIVSRTSTGENMLVANSDGVDAYDLHAKTYLIVGQNSRFEDYDNGSRTGCFWIG